MCVCVRELTGSSSLAVEVNRKERVVFFLKISGVVDKEDVSHYF